MSKQKLTALLTALALILGLCGASALADEGGTGTPSAPAAGETAQTDTPAPAAETGDASQAAGAGTEAPEGGETPTVPEPDPVGTISFANVGSRMKENGLSCRVIEESIARIEATDYKEMEDELRDALNGIADQQWTMMTLPMGLGTMMAASLQASYDSTRETFDNLRDGKFQEDMENVIWQLRSAENQVIMGGETLYISLADLELTSASLDRSLTSLDRTIQELELRYELGQISALTLQETKGGRTSLASSKQTLDMNIQNLKLQLEFLMGADLTGEIKLQALPQVSDADLAAMDLEADLAAAKEASYSLFEARQTLDDAEEDFKDADKEYGDKEYQFIQAQHTWQAAQYTYQNTVQSFELSFRTLYNQVKDYKQVLDASRTALEVEKANCAATQLKYDQGSVSKNALLTAQDDVAAAQETVDGAAIDLFNAYNSYRWAVEQGILN